MKTKICGCCHLEKPLSCFSIDKHTKDGFYWQCKECKNIKARDYRNRSDVKERKRLYMEEYNKNPIVIERNKEWGRKRYSESELVRQKKRDYGNKPEVKKHRREYEKEYRQRTEVKDRELKRNEIRRNTIEYKTYHKNYWKTERGKSAAARSHHKRRKNGSNLLNDLTDFEFNKIVEEQNKICPVCEQLLTSYDPATRDHIIPLSKNNVALNSFNLGLTKSNIQATHGRCNSKKKNKIYFYKAIYTLLE